jgi:hypothetical protein
MAKAMNIPKKMFIQVNQRIPIPKRDAAPPNPIIADVLMKVAP